MKDKGRFITLYIDQVTRTVEVHMQRPNRNRVITCDRVLSSILRVYTLHEGDPSLDRLWKLLKDLQYITYPAKRGWGSTTWNNRSRWVYSL